MGVDGEDDGAELLTKLVGILPTLFSRLEFGDMNETLDSFLDLNEHAKLSDMNDFSRDGLAKEVAPLNRQPGVLAQLLDSKRDALGVAVDVENACLDFITLVETVRGVTDPLSPRHVGDVDQAIDSLVNANKDTEVGDVANSALDDRAHRVGLAELVPGIGLELAHSQRDSLVLHVNAEDLGLNHIAHFDELGGVLDALVPAHLGDVNQSLDAVFEFNECTVIGD